MISGISIRWRKSIRPWVMYRSSRKFAPSTARAGEYTTPSKRVAYRLIITALDNEGSARGTLFLDDGESLV